jgi:transposase-like protein
MPWRMPVSTAGVSSPPSSPLPLPRKMPKRLVPRAQWRQVADQLRPKVTKLATLMDEVVADVLAFMNFPKDHRPKIHSTNPLERLNGEIKRRTDVIGIFSNEDAIIRLVGATLLEQDDEWAVQRARYMTLETIAPLSEDPIFRLPAAAA